MDGSSPAGRDVAGRPVLETIGLTGLVFLVSIVFGVAFIVPALALGYALETTLVLVGSTAAGQLGMGLVGYAYSRYRDVAVSIALPSLRSLAVAAGGVVLALVTAIVLSAVLAALDLVPESVIAESGAANPTFLLGLAALSVVVVAPVEEFVFRGVVQGRLRQRFGPAPAVVCASLLFGSLHLANYAGRPLPIVAGALMIAVIGTVFGALYEWTDNLAVPIVAHAVYNVVLLLLSYVALTAG